MTNGGYPYVPVVVKKAWYKKPLSVALIVLGIGGAGAAGYKFFHKRNKEIFEQKPYCTPLDYENPVKIERVDVDGSKELYLVLDLEMNNEFREKMFDEFLKNSNGKVNSPTCGNKAKLYIKGLTEKELNSLVKKMWRKELVLDGYKNAKYGKLKIGNKVYNYIMEMYADEDDIKLQENYELEKSRPEKEMAKLRKLEREISVLKQKAGILSVTKNSWQEYRLVKKRIGQLEAQIRKLDPPF